MTANMSKIRWIVVATRSNGETLFLCDSPVHGLRFVPYAHSRAERYHSRELAEANAEMMRPEWKGLKIWVEPTVPEDSEMPVNR